MFTAAFWRAWWASALQKDKMKSQIKTLQNRVKMKNEEIRWLREQIDGYRDAFQSLQEEYRARGATAASHIASLSHDRQIS